jgi:RecB family exonuclease
MWRRKSRPRVKGEAPKHRSVAQLEQLAKCGAAYAFRYIENIPEPGSLAKAKGSAVHEAAQVNFEQKIDSDADVPLDDFRDLAVSSFEAEVRGSMLFTRDEESIGTKKATAQQKDATAKLADFYHVTISPEYQPQAIETEFEIPLPSAGTSLVGVIDLVDMLDRVVDHKTSKRSKSQAEADTSLQLTAYGAARTRAGAPPPELVLDTAVQTPAGKSYRNKLVTTRGPDDYKALSHRIVAAEAIIQAGNFGPAPVAAWWCSPQWCGYWTICPFVNRNRTPKE